MTTGFTEKGSKMSGHNGSTIYFFYESRSWGGGDSAIKPNVLVKKHPYYGSRAVEVLTPSGPRWVLVSKLMHKASYYSSRRRPYSRNVYTATFAKYNDRTMEYFAWGSWSKSTCIRISPPRTLPVLTTVLSNNEQISILGKLREKIAGSDFNLAVVAAEAPKTLRMMTLAAHRIRLSYISAKRGLFKEAAKLLRSENLEWHRGIDKKPSKLTASNWLELQYGWLPLISSVHAGAEYLAEYGLKNRVKTFRARQKNAESKFVTSDLLLWDGSVVKRTEISIDIEEVNEAKLIGLEDPASVAWELLPYSFVIDWFIPIQNYLAARSLSSSIQGTASRTTTCITSASRPRASPGNLVRGIAPDTYMYVVDTVRTVLPENISVPLPNFVDLSRVPSFTRCANAIALLVNLKK